MFDRTSGQVPRSPTAYPQADHPAATTAATTSAPPPAATSSQGMLPASGSPMRRADRANQARLLARTEPAANTASRANSGTTGSVTDNATSASGRESMQAQSDRSGTQLRDLGSELLEKIITHADAMEAPSTSRERAPWLPALRWDEMLAHQDRAKALSNLKRVNSAFRTATTQVTQQPALADVGRTLVREAVIHMANYGLLSRGEFEEMHERILAQHPGIRAAVNSVQDPQAQDALISELVHLNRDTALSGPALKQAISKLLQDKPHVGIDLREIKLPRQRAIVLEALREKTDLRSLHIATPLSPSELDAPAELQPGLSQAHKHELDNILEALIAIQNQNPQLTELHLDIADSDLEQSQWPQLAQLHKLTHLNAGTAEFGVQGAAVLGGLSNLKSLVLIVEEPGLEHGIGPQGAAHLAQLTRLEELKLSGQNIGDDGLAALAPLGELKILDLSGNGIEPSAFTHLANFNKLNKFTLDQSIGEDPTLGTDGTRMLASTLAQLPQLKELELPHQDMNDEGAAALAPLKHLTSLNVMGNALTDHAARTIAAMTDLTHLEISENQLTEAGINLLQTLPKLQTIQHLGQEPEAPQAG